MSRIGKKPIPIPSAVEVKISGGTVDVKGPKGKLSFVCNSLVEAKISGKEVIVEPLGRSNLHKSLHGLTRTLIANMIQGVTDGFLKRLEIQGVGYRASVQGKKLQLALGFSHPVELSAPDGITFEIDKEKKNVIIISGLDKCLVGEVAAHVRSLRPPEPYKGKGIRYVGEVVRRKAGKTAAAAKAT